MATSSFTENMEELPKSTAASFSSSSTLPAKQAGLQQQEVTRSEKPETTEDDTGSYVTGVQLVVILAAVSLAVFLLNIDTMVVSTAIPHITDQFNSLADVGWYASAYQFGIAAPQPLTGKIFTHFSTKWSFLVFFAIFELGSVLCGAAVSSDMLIVGRAAAGLGAAGIINGAIMIISGCAPLEKRPGLIGAVVGLGQLGLAVGPVIGGAFTTYSTWRWCFYVNLPLGALTVLGILFLRIPEQTPKARALSVLPKLHQHLDIIGFLLFAPAVLQLLLALQYGGNEFAWNSSQVIGLFCGSGATFVVWLLWNGYMGEDALLPYSMVRRQTVWASSLFQAFFMTSLYGAVFFLPIYFQSVTNASAVRSGVDLLPTILPELFMAVAGGVLLMKIGYVIPLGIVSVVLLSIASGFLSLLKPDSPIGWWVGFQVMGGVGAGLGLNLAINAVQSSVTPQELGSAMSVVVFAQALGPAVFLVLCNVIFDESLASQLSQQVSHLDTAAIIKAGATGFRAIVPSDDLPGVLTAYSVSVDRAFYLVAAASAVCGIVLWGMGWKDIRPKSVTTEEKADADDQQPA